MELQKDNGLSFLSVFVGENDLAILTSNLFMKNRMGKETVRDGHSGKIKKKNVMTGRLT